MDEVYLKALVKRYLEKKSTDEELEIFIYLMQQGKLDTYIREAMDADIALQDDSNPVKKRLFRFNWTVAATIALIAGLSSWLMVREFNPPFTAQTKTVRIRNHSSITQKKSLPDGSFVWLNPGTEILYPSQFGKIRSVQMKGEAFFEVTKDHAHPFVISSGKLITKVWGTSFRIRSIEGENSSTVSVLTGKVSVSVLKDEEVMLLPQEEATYKAAERHLLKDSIPAESDVIVWRKAQLSFENATLEDVAAALHRFYQTDIQIEGETLKKTQLTADFTDKNLADILLLICKSVHTGYIKTDRGIILRTTKLLPITIN